MKVAVVTGAYGFVGRHLVPRLLEDGYSKIVVIDTSTFRRSFTLDEKVECYSGFDANNIQSILSGLGQVDLLVHLAANIVNVHTRMHAGLEAYNDIVLDYNVCKWVEYNKPKCFVAMSSCAVDYPSDPYCIVKRNLEAFATTLMKKGQRTIILRPFSGYGYDQTDEYPFPSILKRAHNRENPLVVWGGNQLRDWLHISDLVEGIIYAVNNFPSDDGPIELGTGRAVNFYDLAKMIALVVGYYPVVQGDLLKSSSSSERRAGISGVKLGQLYGWTPKISLEEGIKLEYSKFLSSNI